MQWFLSAQDVCVQVCAKDELVVEAALRGDNDSVQVSCIFTLGDMQPLVRQDMRSKAECPVAACKKL